jgi:uncharacterized protein (DUF305 family)
MQKGVVMRFFGALSLAVSMGGMAAAYAASPMAPVAEAPFLAENQAAMDKMMKGMQVMPSGDVDRDFAAMMIPHHQGAVDMAQAELRYGHNEKLRGIAQQIISEQPQEIVAMRQALGASSTELSALSHQPASTSMMNMQNRP